MNLIPKSLIDRALASLERVDLVTAEALLLLKDAREELAALKRAREAAGKP